MDKNTTSSPHSHNPVEQDANIKAFSYFTKYNSADFDKYNPTTGIYDGDWVISNNPIVGMDWNNYATNRINNKNYLSNNQLIYSWYDLLFIVDIRYGFILQGIANSIANYFKY